MILRLADFHMSGILPRGDATDAVAGASSRLALKMPAAYIPPRAEIDIPDDELAALTKALRRTIEGDKYPHEPRGWSGVEGNTCG